MISVNNISKTYGIQTIFDGATFTIGDGERVGLTGRNGSGKTTLLKILIGEEESDSGTIAVPNGYAMRYLTQHIHFRESTVLNEACLDLRKGPADGDETYKVKSILTGLGFDANDFYRHPGTLSGGFQVRLNLARILASEPNLLLLDEPTNYLDIVSARWLSQFLRGWRNELVVVTHDRAFMDSVTTHTMGIHRQKVRKIRGTTDKLYEQILQEEEVYERTRINDDKKRKELEDFIDRFRAQATRARSVQSKIKILDRHQKKDKLTDARRLDFSFRYAPVESKWLLEVKGLTFGFADDGTLPLVTDFSLAVKKRDRIGIIGKNGKGKTTLLNLIAGEFVPWEGTVARNQNCRLASFGQMNINRLDVDKTVFDEILAAHPEQSLNAARTIAGIMLFDGDKALKKVSVLSGGERSRVLIGKILVSPANLILLDEPDNHLDGESIDALIEAIDEFEGAVIIVTHSEMILSAICTRLVVFDNGMVEHFEGTYHEFLERIGWADEMVEETPSAAGESVSETVSRKDIRRMKADVINARSRVLTPLQNSISQLEDQIIGIESEVENANAELIRASSQGDGKKIMALSIALHEAKGAVEELFEKLDHVSREFHQRSAEFEDRLSEILRLEAEVK